ncbi:hypothetical protein [Acaryochloris sp. IP29b_bin.148]|uniref:hypothetical protein n=1 Tax=Acaryochloris sp. IP29b_bin.148 TaxID=2969218 RepID=UPI002635ACD4|nr:hypothetical protein [Acaryochloris sp. IP29b_bin.148]
MPKAAIYLRFRQDLGAVELISDRGAENDVEAGRIREAIEKVSYEWASFPPGRYDQNFKSYDELLSFYQQQLDIYS